MLVEKPRLPLRELVLTGPLPSFLKIFIYRLRGYKIGRKVTIGFGSVVVGKDVEIGDGVSIGLFTIIRGRQIQIGRYVTIRSTTMIDTERIEILEDARINEQVFIGGLSTPDSYIRIGKRSLIMQMSFLNPAKPLMIGNDTVVGGHTLIFTHGSWHSVLDGYQATFEPITIGNNVYIAWRVFIMPGVTIGNDATIGANSLVNRSIPVGSLAVGSPAKILKTAAEYPQPKTPEKQNDLILTFLKEFLQYLSYHDLRTEVLQETPLFHAVVKTFKSSDKDHNLYYTSHSADPPAGLSERSVFMALQRISDDARAGIAAAGAMWLDLERRERSGSCDIGEEAVQFLSRYGLRFNRVD